MRHQNYKCLFFLTISILVISLLLPSCGGDGSEREEEIVTQEEAVEEERGAWVHDQSRSGRISQDEIWPGTIHVTGDIWVDENATITIAPGTTVLISAGRDDQNSGVAANWSESDKEKHGPISTEEYAKSHIEINGRIIAVGTPDEMIVFTSDSPNPNFADWSSIELRPGSRMEYCIVEYAGRAGVGIWSNIPEDDSVLVSNCIIRHIFMGGIALGGTTCARVTSNEVSDCGSEGIAVTPGGGVPYIAYNTVKHTTVGIGTLPESFAVIENNILIDNIKGIVTRAKDTIRHNHISSPTRQIHEQSYMGHTFPYAVEPPVIKFIGIVAAEHCQATIQFNNIVSNEIGILIGPGGNPPQTLENNNIYDNDMNIDNQTNLDIVVQHNWWGTTDTHAIEQKIWDYDDDPSKGKVNYEPVETSEIEGAGPKD
jgi:hypothetical protein